MKDTWLTVNPSSGEGNSKLSNSATDYKGRLSRSTVVSVKGKGVEEKTYKVTQKAYEEYLLINTVTFDVGELQSQIEITGKSNSPIIEYVLTSDNGIPISLPTTFTYTQGQTSGSGQNGVNLTTDPGSVGEFNFVLKVTIPKNNVGARVGKIKFTGSTATVTATVTINQETSTYQITYQKGSYIASISKNNEVINYGGNASCVATLLSNDAQYTYTFDGWYEGSNKIGSSLTLSVTNITAVHTYIAKGIRTVNRYTITTLANPTDKGSVSGGGTYDYGTEVNLVATPITGYHFENWSDSSTEGASRTITVIANKSYTANFAINVYTAKATAGTGGNAYVVAGEDFSGTASSVKIEHGGKATWKAFPSAGYRFNKWSGGSTSTSNPITLTLTSDVTCNATFIKTYTITVTSKDENKGTVTGGGVYDTGASVKLTATRKTGYTFDGWYNGSSKVSSANPYTFTASQDLKLDADWIVYNVTINAKVSPEEKGIIEGLGSYQEGTSNHPITATPITGYHFVKWTYASINNPTGEETLETIANPFPNLTWLQNRNITAYFEINTYTVNANSQYRVSESGDWTSGTTGGTVTGGGTYDYGTSLTIKATAATGYSFAGWYEGDSLTSSNASYTFTVTADRTFIGRFQRNWYTISASSENTDYGTVSPASQRIEYGKTATVTATRKTGYILEGWYEGSSKVGSNNTLSVASITAAHTYVAKWKVYTITITPTISPAGGGTVSAITGQEGTQISITATPNSGYRFNNWVVDDQSFVSNPLGFVVREGRTVVANFTKTYVVSVSAKYRNTDNTGDYTTGTSGGTVSGGGTFDTGSKVTLTASPATGYTFVGWFNSSDTSVGTSTTYTITSLTANTTLVGKFQKNWYTATYTKGTGIATISKTTERVAYNGSITAVTITLTEGYENPTWTNTGTATFDVAANKLSASASAIKSNITMVASATIKKFVITATAQYRNADNTGSFTTGTTGGTTTGSATYNYGTTATLKATAATGYTFQGWYDAEGTQVSTSATYTIAKVTAAVTVYARFQKNWYTVTYNKGTGISTVSKTSERVAYNGSTTAVSATLATGYNSGTWVKTSGTATLKVDGLSATLTGVQSNVVLTASASINVYTITYTKGDYINTISKTSESVNYGGTATCTATLLANTAQYTYTFDGWYEGATKVGSALALSVASITAAHTYTAKGIRTINKYTAAAAVNNANYGSATVKTASGTAAASISVDYNTSVIWTATRKTGYQFSKWSNDSTDNPYTQAVTANTTLTATFVDLIYNQITAIPEGEQRTAGNRYTIKIGSGEPVTDRTNYQINVREGSSVVITANPTTGWHFVNITEGGTSVSTTSPYTYTVSKARTLSINFAINTYTITYSKGTGIATISKTSESVNHGATASGCTATVTTGYTFDGWYTVATGGTRVSTSLTYAPTNVTAAATYYARATINKYTVTLSPYYRNTDGTGDYTSGTTGGTVSGGGSYNYGSSVTITATAATGYKFDGWYTAASGGSLVSSSASYTLTSSITANQTVYARFTRLYYTITYSKNAYVSSVSRASERVEYGKNALGSTLTLLANTAQYTYTIDGWYSGNSRVVTTATYAPTAVKANATYEARGTRTVNKYTVTATAQYRDTDGTGSYTTGTTGGTASGGGSVDYGSTKTLTASATTQYNFDGWYNSSGTQVSTSLTYSPTITANVTYYARFTKKYFTVTYTAGNYVASNNPTSERVVYGGTAKGSTMTVMTTTAQYSYGIDGWYLGNTKQNSTAASPKASNVTAAVTYTSKGTRTLRSYTIAYSAGTGVSSVSRTSETVNYGANAAGSTATQAADTAQYAYTWDGWYTAATGGTRVSTSKTYAPTSITGAATYYARCTATTRSYTITATAQYRNTDGTGDYTTGTTGGTASGGGSGNYGTTKALTAVAATGYTFDGWYNSSGTRVSTSTSYSPTITGAATYYARFTKIYYTITYNKGSYIASVSRASERVAYNANALGSTATPTATTAEFSYSFSKWTVSTESGSTASTSATYAPTAVKANATYVAVGSRATRSYTVKFDGNGGTPASQTLTRNYGATIGTFPTSPSKAQDNYNTYSFNGWYTAASGGTKIATTQQVTGAVTYYAQYTATARSYTISTSVSPSGSGTVSGGGSYAYNSSVKLTASASSGYKFSKWSDGNTTNPRTITVTGNASYQAVFVVSTATVAVSLDSTSAGRGSVSGGGTFNIGSSVTVKCTMNNSGDVFGGWYNGSTKVSSSLSYTFTLSASISLKALIYYIDITPTSLSFEAGGGTKSFTVTSNVTGWTIS